MADRDSRKPRQRRSTGQRALGLLTRREHSRSELVRKLIAGGADAEEANSVTDRLAAAGWQDDMRFADSLVRSRASAGYGPRRVQAELAVHGINRDTAAAAIEGFEGDWGEVAVDLVRRRFGEQAPHDLATLRRAADLLVRRGFTPEQIRMATRFHAEDD
jgi:regulatory protein